METIIKIDRKSIIIYIRILTVVGALFSLPFIFINPTELFSDNALLFFMLSFNALWFCPLFYVCAKLISSRSPQLVISNLGVEFKGKRFYEWDEISYYWVSQITIDAAGGDIGSRTSTTLIFKLKNGISIEFPTTYFPLNESPYEIVKICDAYRNP